MKNIILFLLLFFLPNKSLCQDIFSEYEKEDSNTSDNQKSLDIFLNENKDNTSDKNEKSSIISNENKDNIVLEDLTVPNNNTGKIILVLF
jgi:hypothetical protein